MLPIKAILNQLHNGTKNVPMTEYLAKFRFKVESPRMKVGSLQILNLQLQTFNYQPK